jgi:hypothetical protein
VFKVITLAVVVSTIMLGLLSVAGLGLALVAWLLSHLPEINFSRHQLLSAVMIGGLFLATGAVLLISLINCLGEY